MASTPTLQDLKGTQLAKIMGTHDFGVFSEVHSTTGKADAYRLPPGCVGFWSHLSSARAGVGIVLKDTFLARFRKIKDDDFVEFDPGRLARLRLEGPEGCLDIWTVYCTTGKDVKARDHTHAILGANLAPARSVLSIVAGDWNYVVQHEDRWCCTSKMWTGRTDQKEAERNKDSVFEPAGLHELHQEQYTHFTTDTNSRLDRVYTNHHTSEQLDHKFGCCTLPRRREVSTHAPLSFFRRRSSGHQGDVTQGTSTKNIAISSNMINHPDWPSRVAAELQHISTEHSDYNNPVRRMVLVKRAMHTVSTNMRTEGCITAAMTTDDKLNCTLGFARAAQQCNLNRMRRKALEYPHIATLVDPENPIVCHESGFNRLLDHAVELARQNITEELQDIQKSPLGDNDYHNTIRRKNVLAHLKRLIPGNCNTIGAIELKTGEYKTTPEEIATALSEHWAKTFQHKPIDHQLLQSWLQSLPSLTAAPGDPPRAQQQTSELTNHGRLDPTPTGPQARPQTRRRQLPRGSNHWRIRREDIQKAIHHSGNSAPGPDGIPFKAWRRLGPLAVTILMDVVQLLQRPDPDEWLQQAYWDEDTRQTHLFNESILVCLPKKSTKHLEDGTAIYELGNTRPLNIVNSDNRILASAARNRYETNLAGWILPRQQGFLPGRSLLANLLDVESANMITSLNYDSGACILMDFASAFPSISQEFMMTVLEQIGIPKGALNMIKALYNNSFCMVRHGKIWADGFKLEAGVRQGCPLSPLLYATVAEVLMDKIEQDYPDTLVRAYADDTALVLTNFWHEAPILQQIFAEFGVLSGLRLNLSKCVTIPLDGGSLETFKTRRQLNIPAWSTMPVATSGKYLGFMIGPGKEQSSWNGPVKKYLNICDMGRGHAIGLQFNVAMYNTFAISTLGFIGQLEQAPQFALDAETQGLRRAIKGPGNWAVNMDMWLLKEQFGQPRSCFSLALTARAAQLRVRTWDPACTHAHYKADCAALRKAMSNPWRPHTRHRWSSWYDNGFCLTLERNYEQYISEIGSIGDLLSPNAHETLDSDEEPTATNPPAQKLAKIGFQRRTYHKLLRHYAPDPTNRVRYKIQRFGLQHPSTRLPEGTSIRQNTPDWQSRRALASLQILPRLVPPRVCAAVFSTMWNRWNTHRRWQRRHTSSNRCLLGCEGAAEDSIEHYCCCRLTRRILQKQFNLPDELFANLHSFLLCNANINTTEHLTCIALLIYGIYNATNHFRHNPTKNTTHIYDATVQWIREGARHHSNASRTLVNRWNTHHTLNPLPPFPTTFNPSSGYNGGGSLPASPLRYAGIDDG